MFAFLVVATLASCGGKTTTTTTVLAKPSPPSLLETIAAELDVGPQEPLWGRLPAARIDLERAVTAPAAAPARLELARAQFATFSQEMDAVSPEAVTARLVAGLHVIYLAEPVVFATAPGEWTALQRDGALMLHELYSRLDRPALGPWLRAEGRAKVDAAILDAVLGAAPTMRRYLAAALLRAGTPEPTMVAILRDLATRTINAGDPGGARPLYDEVLRRSAKTASAVDWIDAGVARARSEDLPAAVAALEEATARARGMAQDRSLGARLRTLRQDVQLLERYQAAKPATEIERKLVRFDLLLAFARTAEARTILDELERALPKDARVRVRTVVLKIDAMGTTDNMVAMSQAAIEALQDSDLENLDGDYWSLVVGTLGFRAVTDVLATFQTDKVAGARLMLELLQYMREVAKELAKTRPGRAAALDTLLASATTVFSSARSFEDEIGDVLRAGFSAVVALRQQHPNTADVERIVYSFASFADNPDRALAIVVEPPGTSSDDDAGLYLQRARVAVSLARQIATAKATETACATIADIPPTFETGHEAAREALLGDCAALTAITANDPTGWQRALTHYTAALAGGVEDERPRLLHNLAFATLQSGDREGAVARFTEAAALEGGRRFLPRFVLLTLTATPEARLDGLRELVRERAAAGDPLSIYLGTWLAHLSTDPTESRTTAAATLAQMADRFRAPSPAALAHGLESEGTFQLGLGIAARQLYALNAQVYSSVWFVLPPPLDRAALEAKATAGKPPKRPAKR